MRKLLLFLIMIIALPCNVIGQAGTKKVDPLKKITLYKADNFESTETYTHKSLFNNSTRGQITGFITKNNRSKRIFFEVRFSYYGLDWIHFERVSLKFTNDKGEQLIRFDVPKGQKNESTAFAPKVYESSQLTPSAEQLALIKDAIAGKDVYIRCDGGKRYDTGYIVPSDMRLLGEVIAAYEAMCEQTGYENVNATKIAEDNL